MQRTVNIYKVSKYYFLFNKKSFLRIVHTTECAFLQWKETIVLNRILDFLLEFSTIYLLSYFTALAALMLFTHTHTHTFESATADFNAFIYFFFLFCRFL